MGKIAEKLEKIIDDYRVYRNDEHDFIKRHSKTLALAIEKYILDAKKKYFVEVCEFLSKEGYLDDDWWCEQPTALERWEDKLKEVGDG